MSVHSTPMTADERDDVPEALRPRGVARRRLDSTVERLTPVRARQEFRISGEIPLAPSRPDEPSDLSSGLLAGVAPASEEEVAPLVKPRPRRPVGRVEQIARFAVAALALALLLAAFAEALRWAVMRVATGRSGPWRDVPVLIDPGQRARVFINGQLRGEAPLQARVACRNRIIRLRLEAPGHGVWEWSGLCPERGQLELRPRLQPLP